MRLAIVPFVVFSLLIGIGLATSCGRSDHHSTKNVQVKPAVERAPNKANTVSYKGVHFTFDPSLTAKVKSETIPAMLDGKPCDIVPDHPAFTLVGYPRLNKLSDDNSPQIRVFQIAAFRDAVGIASHDSAKSVVYPPNPPDWTLYFDEEVRTLKTLLERKPPRKNLSPVIVKARRDHDNTEMPFLPMWEASQAFVSQLKYVSFKNGRGVFFLTQWDTETSQITNEGLEYAFQGMTDDGQYYVYAEFSVTAPFLPTGTEPEVVAWNEKNYLLPHKSKEYQSYLRPVVEKLEALPADQFRPNLTLIENLVESLQIDTDQPHQQ